MMKLVGEFLGTTILLWAVTKYGTPLAVGLALALAIYLFGHMSGGHYNPAVTFMKYLSGGMSQGNMMKYIAAQMAAAFVLLKFLRR